MGRHCGCFIQAPRHAGRLFSVLRPRIDRIACTMGVADRFQRLAFSIVPSVCLACWFPLGLRSSSRVSGTLFVFCSHRLVLTCLISTPPSLLAPSFASAAKHPRQQRVAPDSGAHRIALCPFSFCVARCSCVSLSACRVPNRDRGAEAICSTRIGAAHRVQPAPQFGLLSLHLHGRR